MNFKIKHDSFLSKEEMKTFTSTGIKERLNCVEKLNTYRWAIFNHKWSVEQTRRCMFWGAQIQKSTFEWRHFNKAV